MDEIQYRPHQTKAERRLEIQNKIAGLGYVLQDYEAVIAASKRGIETTKAEIARLEAEREL